MSGKGDKRRPMTVQYDLFESNWDRIFRRKQVEDQWSPEVKDKMLREDNGITTDNIDIDWNKAAKYSVNPPSIEELDMLREVTYDGEKVGTFDATDLDWAYDPSSEDRMWKHSCTLMMGVVNIAKGEVCNYCGAWEEDIQ